ncbi:conserved exported hypothetical protein [Capnocytophaga canis]|uniref:DUF5686 and carboxypeptidase regulatory-like domain-containing protein n=1 Tax=Capnocytophaga canis TaxID=1848903 RepID=UPI000589AF9D|nr:DUF5686 and carboxypeptidase regulatory-like domain-containing protein [Capnocytophaga canis]CEN43667.1 conserved exported hypothetical protein [Capnocytophaga canis]
MRQLLTSILLGIFAYSFGQIQGTVTDQNQQPIPFVSVYIENGTKGTTSNEKGMYLLNTTDKNPTVVFQSLGYKTERRTIQIDKTPYILNISLSEESYLLSEVTVSSKENPANGIIRNAIKHKTRNSEKTDRFEADFYSKGFLKLMNVPKKILGQEVGDMGGNIDTITRSGIVYQSETISKIKFEKPRQIKEHIIASKVAGNSNGFSFNTAASANFDFYDNYMNFDAKMISPIADNAFSYYRYQLESTFYDDQKRLVNKIKLIPRRDKEPVFEGYIYILEDLWAIYAVEVTAKGYRMNNPAISELHIVQNFGFNETYGLWTKNLQRFDLKAKIFMVSLEGTFSYVYNNYQFKDSFSKNEFKGEVRRFEQNSNKKDSIFWQKNRQIPLTEAEIVNYRKKDSVETVRTSDKYIDSVETKNNKFGFFDIFTGYSYRKTSKRYRFGYDGFIDPGSMGFNTVQGYFLGTGFYFSRWNKEKTNSTNIGVDFQYSFAEKKLRTAGYFTHLFNRINYPRLSVRGGSEIHQFNRSQPISGFVNEVMTLFFRDNYMKLYHEEFLYLGYGQNLTPETYIDGSLRFSNRSPLKNNTNYSFSKKNKPYLSNNPLLPLSDEPSFEPHYTLSASIYARFRFNRTYTSFPNRRIYNENDRYPEIVLGMKNVLSASKKSYQYQQLHARVDYEPSFDNKGDMFLCLNGGLFFNAKHISFVDYKHFNGNLTHLQVEEDPNASFYLLPYYSHSTNEAYAEFHARHRFRGYISNKLPLFNKLQWHFVTGFHQLHREGKRPYTEFTIGLENVGWGKIRPLRVDYVRSFDGNKAVNGVMFGIKLFD